MPKNPPGLRKRGDIWWIWKHIGGRKIRQSTGTRSLYEAEKYLAHVMEESRRVEMYGDRPTHTFRSAAIRYLETTEKASLRVDNVQLGFLDPFIGSLPIERINMGTLQSFIQARRVGHSIRTVNYGLQVVRRILNLAAGEWFNNNGTTWLAHAPKISLLAETDRKEPYPLSWEEQDRLFAELPDHLRPMALFAVNTGCREQEVCGLRWDWEVKIPTLNTSVFIIPRLQVKNRTERLVVLNSIASEAIESVRGEHPEYVFTFQRHPPTSPRRRLNRMNAHGWKAARERAGLSHVRVHDLKHTYGMRLREAGVSFEDRQDLLGHKSKGITTHYSAPELISLLRASESVCGMPGHKPGTIIVMSQKVRALRVKEAMNRK